MIKLEDNDVLLGRGSGQSQYIGSRRFRAVVETRRAEYTANPSYKVKARIAREVFEEITSRGGRFLELVDTGKRIKNLVDEGVWRVVTQSVALEKCKQALREKKENQETPDRNEASRRTASNEQDRETVDQNGGRRATEHTASPSAGTPSSVLGDNINPAAAAAEVVDKKRAASDASNGVSNKEVADNSLKQSGRMKYTGRLASVSRGDPSSSFGSQCGSYINVPAATAATALPIDRAPYRACDQSSFSNVLPRTLLANAGPASSADIYLSLLQRKMALNSHEQSLLHEQIKSNDLRNSILSHRLQNSMMTARNTARYPPRNSVPHERMSGACHRHLEDGTLQPSPLVSLSGQSYSTESKSNNTGYRQSNVWQIPEQTNDTGCVTDGHSPSEDSSAPADDMETALFALSALAVAGCPTFTEQQEEIERATMTDEERAAALSDIFGKYCDIDSPQRKRARKDLDSDSIEFLISQMRVELEQIPACKKQALMEAQTKCEAFEFSDKRLERFLRCEGMNAKVCALLVLVCRNRASLAHLIFCLRVIGSKQLGAQRFVNYWESRRELFGEEKYLMRMTLSEALRDDLDAIEAGVFRMLPHLDSSGRQILFLDPSRRSGDLYSSESLVR